MICAPGGLFRLELCGVCSDTVQNAAEICLKFGGWQADKQAKFQERQRLASARVKVGQGHQLARQGDVAGAIAAFQAAQQLDPSINLEPRSTPPKTDPHAVAQHLTARAKAKEQVALGSQLARQGNVEKALQVFAGAEKLDPSLATNAAFWNEVAWEISLGGDAAKGLRLTAIDISPEVMGKDYPAFLEKYKSKYGESPINAYHAQAFDAAVILAKAIEKVAKTDDGGTTYIGKKALRDELFATKGYEGLSGPINCNPHGQCGGFNFAVYQYVDPDPATFKVGTNPIKIYPKK